MISSFYNDKLVRTSSLLFITSMVSNVFNYAFQIVMGRMLIPQEYGLMNALFSLLSILSVPVAPLFTVVARKTSEYKAKEDFRSIGSLYRKFSNKVLLFGISGLIIFSLGAPYIRDYLHAPSTIPILILGIAIVTTFAQPLNMAVLQGVQNYKWIGINQGLGGPAKLLFTVMLVLAGFSVNGVMAGMVLTGLLLWSLSYWPLRNYTSPVAAYESAIQHISFREVVPVFLALFAFAILTQADMVLVRRYFSAHEAGIYASAAILGKAVMYLPGAIVIAMFPMVSGQHALNQSSRHVLVKSLAITVSLSGAGAALFLLFPGWIMGILYGTRYAAACEVLKYYGIAMLPMALLMVLMNYLIARKQTLFSYLMIIGALLEILAIYFYHQSLLQVVVIMLIIGTLLCIASIALQYIPIVQRQPDSPEGQVQ